MSTNRVQHKLKAKPIPLKKENKSSLLHLSATEKAQIIALNVIGGFTMASGMPGVVETVAEEIPSVVDWIGNNLAAGLHLGAAGTVGIASIGGLGVVGMAAGAYFANEEINNELDTIIRLNKTLFIMFNIAADRLAAWKTMERKTDDAIIERKLADVPISETPDAQAKRLNELKTIKAPAKKLKDDYYEALKQIHCAVSNYSVERPFTDQDNHCLRMQAIIEDYARHRASNLGKHENELWGKLKANNAIGHVNSSLTAYFLDYTNEKQVKEHFHGQHKKEASNFLSSGINLQKIVESLRQYYSGEALKEYEKLLRAFHPELRKLYTAVKKVLPFDPAAVEEKYNAIQVFINRQDVEIPADIAQALHDVWEDRFFPLCETILRNKTYLGNANTRAIIDSTHQIFGSSGTFRQFWQQLPTKTYKLYNQNLEKPLNFESEIHHGGENPSTKAQMIFVGSGWLGLYGTGHGLYVAAIALGAAALSATVAGLIVSAAALGLVLIGLALYRRTQTMHASREVLATKLETGCAVMVGRIEHEIDKEQRKSIAAQVLSGAGVAGHFARSKSVAARVEIEPEVKDDGIGIHMMSAPTRSRLARA